jgi:hypothetical protein
MSTLNVTKLFRELAAAGLPVVGVDANGKIDYSQPLDGAQMAVQMTVLANHDPVDYIQQREAAAAVAAKSIPSWATWTDQQAQDYINANVTTLAQAKVVLVALARMVVALRDHTWPEFRGEGPG